MKLKVIVHQEDDGYWAEVPALTGCFTQADTFPELLQNLYEAIEGWLETKFSLEQFLAQVTKDNLHNEVDTGTATGREVW